MVLPLSATSKIYTDSTERNQNSRFEDFFQQESPSKISSAASGRRPMSASSSMAHQLRDKRDRFARQIEISNWNKLCCAVDRATVISIYNEALQIIAQWDTHRSTVQINYAHDAGSLEQHNIERYNQLEQEVDSKVKIALGVTSARPDHAVFSNRMLLQPLEPRYATPRIEYHNDPNQYHSEWRLEAWRKDGWPEKYPAKAIKSEIRAGTRVSGKAEGYDALLNQFGNCVIDWGDQVDAGGGREDDELQIVRTQ